MYFADVLKQDQMFANEPWMKDRYVPIYNEQEARDKIKYLTRNLYKSGARAVGKEHKKKLTVYM